MEILQSIIPHINELVRLTEALRGNYTLEEEEYGEWNKWSRMQDEAEEAQFMRDQRILRRQLREFGRETNPLFEMDEELEQQHDALICKPRREPMQVADEEEDDDSESGEKEDLEYRTRNEKHRLKREVKTDEERSKKKSHTNTKQFNEKHLRRRSSEDTNQDVDGCNNKRQFAVKKQSLLKSDDTDDDGKQSSDMQSETTKRAGTITTKNQSTRRSDSSCIQSDKVEASNTTREHVTSLMSNEMHYLPSVEQKEAAKQSSASNKARIKKKRKKPKIARAMLKDPPELCFPSTSLTTNATTNPVENKLPAARGVKKCHDCKAAATRYRKCSYWHLTGKCGKVFCINCLSSKYTLGDDVLSDDNPRGIPIDDIVQSGRHDSDWHCPSCLKKCQCKSCVNQRQREEEKERSRDQAERKSSRRSTQSDFSNFFQANGGGISFSFK
jgi:hypothetical protein